jgi:hypothetical protein
MAAHRIQSMKRSKATQLDFFPTGFVITALPTLLVLLGGLGYGSYKSVRYFVSN